MRLLDEIMQANQVFLSTNQTSLRQRSIPKVPRRNIAIFTCMDSRLVELLEPAMGISRGDAHVLKNAGNTLADPRGGVVRSLVVSVYTLGVEEILVVGHRDCGMAEVSADKLKEAMLARGIPAEDIERIREMDEWLGAFADPEDNVRKVVSLIRSSPLIPKDVPIHGLIMEPNRGALTVLVDGYDLLPG